MDKYSKNEISIKQNGVVECTKDVMQVSVNNSGLLNVVYKEISKKLGMDTSMNISHIFKGQQISFSVRFFNTGKIQELIIKEYDGNHVRTLVIKYNYSEKTIRKIIKESVDW